MPVTRLLSHWFGQHAVIGHRSREAALFKLVEALLGGSKLVLTQLGRHRAGEAYTKHHIKVADRLLGNRHLHAERDGIEECVSRPSEDSATRDAGCSSRSFRFIRFLRSLSHAR